MLNVGLKRQSRVLIVWVLVVQIMFFFVFLLQTLSLMQQDTWLNLTKHKQIINDPSLFHSRQTKG